MSTRVTWWRERRRARGHSNPTRPDCAACAACGDAALLCPCSSSAPSPSHIVWISFPHTRFDLWLGVICLCLADLLHRVSEGAEHVFGVREQCERERQQQRDDEGNHFDNGKFAHGTVGWRQRIGTDDGIERTACGCVCVTAVSW